MLAASCLQLADGLFAPDFASFPITQIFNLTEKIERVYPQKLKNKTAAEIRSMKSGCGGPEFLGRIPDGSQ
jgi:hypothetical protein